MKCKECNAPLRVIKGGQRTDEGSTKITNIHAYGCLNKKCSLVNKEQTRTETKQDSFNE